MKSTIQSFITTLTLLAITATTHGATTTYAGGDLLLGFRQTGNTSDYLVNIGQASLYTGATSSKTISSLASDLVAVFGSDWASAGNVFWSVSGTNRLVMTTANSDPGNTMYATRISTGSAWTSAFAQGTPVSGMWSVATAYKGKASTANNPSGLIQNNIGTSTNNAYASYQPSGVNAGAGNLAFGYFNPSIEGNSSNGISTTTLNLYRLAEGSADPGTLVGTFTISSGGTVTFTPAVTSAFAAWATSRSLSGANALPAADPDNDQLSNMVEFVLNSDPSSATAQNLPTVTENTSNLTFSFPHNAASVAEYNVTVQTSTDLVNWSNASAGTENAGTYTKVIAKNGAAKLFARLQVTSK